MENANGKRRPLLTHTALQQFQLQQFLLEEGKEMKARTCKDYDTPHRSFDATTEYGILPLASRVVRPLLSPSKNQKLRKKLRLQAFVGCS